MGNNIQKIERDFEDVKTDFGIQRVRTRTSLTGRLAETGTRMTQMVDAAQTKMIDLEEKLNSHVQEFKTRSHANGCCPAYFC